MHLTIVLLQALVDGCSLDVLEVVGTPKGVDLEAAAVGRRYDDDVISKQERANDDRNIMYAKRQEQQRQGSHLISLVGGTLENADVRIFAMGGLLKHEKRSTKNILCFVQVSTWLERKRASRQRVKTTRCVRSGC